MGGYNFHLSDDDDQLDLMTEAAPEEIAVRPGPLSGERLNLDIVAPPESPVQESPASISNGQTDNPYKDQIDYWTNKAKAAAERSGSFANKEPVQISTAPDWYKEKKYEGPPGSNDWAKALIGMGSGMISGPAQAGLDNPLRPFSQKQTDAKQVALGNGLDALLGGLVGGKRKQYDDDLEAAQKQSSMNKLSHSGSTGALSELNNATKMLGILNQSRSIDSVEKNRSLAQAREAELHNQNSPELVAAKKLLVAKGMATPEELEGQTLATLQKQYGLINTSESEAGKNARQEAGAVNDRSKIAVQKNAESEAKAEAKRNEDLQREAQAHVGDDVEWKGGLPPDEATQRKAREIYGAKKFGIQALDRMTQIQQELEGMSRGYTGTVDEWLGRVAGTPEAAKAQELVAEAAQIQNFLTIEARKISNMGVPQEWEQRLVASLNPRAGSLIGYLKGNANWQALKKSLSDYAQVGMDSNGLVARGSGQVRAKPTYETKQAPVPGVAKVKGKQVVSEDEPLPNSGETLPVQSRTASIPPNAQIPAGAADAAKYAKAGASAPGQPTAGKRTYVITPANGGKSFTRDLTEEEFQLKSQAGKGKFEIRPQ